MTTVFAVTLLACHQYAVRMWMQYTFMTNSNSTLSVLTAQFRRTQKPLLYIGFLNDHVGEAFQGACKSPYTQVRQHD